MMTTGKKKRPKEILTFFIFFSQSENSHNSSNPKMIFYLTTAIFLSHECSSFPFFLLIFRCSNYNLTIVPIIKKY